MPVYLRRCLPLKLLVPLYSVPVQIITSHGIWENRARFGVDGVPVVSARNVRRGEDIIGDTMLLLLNAHHEAIPFTLPATREGELWERLLDTADPRGMPLACTGGQQYKLRGRAMAVLRTMAQQEEAPQPLATAAVGAN